MRIIEQLEGKNVYFDTNIFIYLFEGSPEYIEIIKPIMNLAELDEIKIFTSQLTLAELLVHPFKNQQTEKTQAYIEALNNPNFLSLEPITQDICIKTAEIQARHRIKLPDAVHIASALSSGCEVFLTNDKKIKSIPDLEMVYIS